MFIISTINNRLKKVRKECGLSQEAFGKILGIKRSGVCDIESGRRNVTEQHLIMLSNQRDMNVNIEYLRTGEGDMFKKIPEEDETAVYVSELLEDEDNPLFDIIKEIMHTYNELDPKSKEALKIFSANLITNLKRRA